jgi:hypothetical protein
MNLRQKLNEKEWVKKVNGCDFGMVVTELSEVIYEEITNKKVPVSERIAYALVLSASYPIQLTAGYLFLKALKGTRD